MPFKDVREFIARLEKEGEAQRIEEEVDWNLEAGAMLRRSYEARLPVPFFQKVKGYPGGYRLFGGILSNYRRLAIAMDLAPDTPQKQIMEEYLRRSKNPIKPILVKDGPCKENIHVGDEVDLLEFPVPMVHEGDGGRYIGTWHLVITKDLDSDWVNWGMYRHMVHNKNTMGVLAHAFGHIGMMYHQTYTPRNKAMEVVTAIGTEPISSLCAATMMPYGISEVDVAGGIRGEPVELIKCATADISVPATAEIVIEGEIRPNDLMEEGPFGEYTGYQGGLKELRPAIRVKAITHRNDPILTMTCEGVPVTESHVIQSITKAAELSEALAARGLPVNSVSVPPETCALLAVVAVKTVYSNIAEQLAHVVWGSRPGQSIPYLVVVNDDVDVFDIGEVLHAIATKCHPYRGIVRLEHALGHPLYPFASAYERKNKLGARAYFDCTWPLDWDPAEVPTKASFEKIYPSDVQREALAKWQKYGY